MNSTIKVLYISGGSKIGLKNLQNVHSINKFFSTFKNSLECRISLMQDSHQYSHTHVFAYLFNMHLEAFINFGHEY